MLVSHREIVACYHNGTDVHRIIARRVKYIQGAAVVSATNGSRKKNRSIALW